MRSTSTTELALTGDLESLSGLLEYAVSPRRSRTPFAYGMEEELSGSCPDVPVPVSKRPRVLVRKSKHSAVREAQRKLNAFHAYRVAAGLPGLRDSPLVEDCDFGKHTFEAVKSFQELVFP